MKKILSKKVSVFGKGIPVFAIVLVGAALVSAALLSYYGSITGNAVVSQSVVLNNKPCTTEDACTELGAWNGSFVAGDFVSDCDNSVKNNANVPATINFTTTCKNSTGSVNCTGITTEVYGVLELSTKNVNFTKSPWEITGTAKANVKYTIVGSSISAEVIDSTGISNLGDYTLIYYKDNSNRFSDPAKAIKLSEITGSLPYVGDGNLDEYNYCGGTYQENVSTGDNYVHCHGAKIWLVPTDAILTNNDLNWSKASNFLFETDLIVYSNSTENKITLPSKGGFNFCVDNEFQINLKPDKYNITTQVLPITA